MAHLSGDAGVRHFCAVISRRGFLATVGALAAGAACRNAGSQPQVAQMPGRRRLDRIGIQLYTVRDAMRRDMPGTLAQIAQIGYREVEFAGYFGRTPRDVRAMLDGNGLTSPSTHISLDLARQDRTFDDSIEIGHRYLTVPSLPRASSSSADAYRRTAEELNQIGAKAKARGLRLAYHNHSQEFTPLDGAVPYDLLVGGTDPSLVFFQVDAYWMVRGGRDPREFVRAHPGRVPMLHLKDSSGPPDQRQVDVGAGTIDFAAILRQDASQRRSITSVFVEHDGPPDPMSFARNSFAYLSKLEY
jgi:sugar phosphate isomerase/epimerase